MTLRNMTSAFALSLATLALHSPALAQAYPVANPVANPVDSQFELAFWQAVATSEDKAQYGAYLAKYPNGTFSALAALKIAALGRGSTAPAAPVSSFSPSASSYSSSSSSSSSIPRYSGSSSGMRSSSSMGGSGSSYGSSSGNSSMGGGSSMDSSAMGSGSSSSGNSAGSTVGSSSMSSSSGSSAPGATRSAQPSSTKTQLLGAAMSLGAALMASSKQKKAAKQASSLIAGGSSSSGSSGVSQPKSGAQGILGQLLPVANGLTGGKLGSGVVGGAGGQQGGTTLMLVNTALQLVVPNRPSLTQVDTPNLPTSFCSADARNAFHDTVFKPAMAKADQNNDSAIAYMQVLQQLFDAAGAKKDNAKMSCFSSEARSFSSIAGQTQNTRLSFIGLFSQLMAVPIGKC